MELHSISTLEMSLQPAMQWLSVIVLGYLMGAIPFAVIVGRFYGVDVLTQGSKNPGATNVKRLAGNTAGNIVFALDAFKGLIAAGWPIVDFLDFNDPITMGIAGLVSAVVGHSYSVFLRFRGGKGVATTMGGLLAIMPIPLGIGVACWGLIFFVTRYVSLASIIFAVSLPISAAALRLGPQCVLLGIALAFFIIAKHRSNIVRICNGTEHKFTKH